MKVSVELDLYPDSEITFEELLENAIIKKLAGNFQSKAEAFINDKYLLMLQTAIDVAVDKKMRNLLNEDIVLMDKWGKKLFVGSPEDYIKTQIDDHILYPVDSSGKRLSGCTSSGKTWLEWTVEKVLQNVVTNITEKTKATAMNTYTQIAKEVLDEIKTSSAKEALAKVMQDVLIK